MLKDVGKFDTFTINKMDLYEKLHEWAAWKISRKVARMICMNQLSEWVTQKSCWKKKFYNEFKKKKKKILVRKVFNWSGKKT